VGDSRLCVFCEAQVGADDVSCASCGGRLRPLEPSGISLQVGQQPAGEERRQVTIVFADLAGNTPLAERLDPEEMRRVLESLFDRMSREILKVEGTVDKYVGDAVMAVFGAPIAHEDDPSRAVTAALGMRHAVFELSQELERRYGTRLSLRIGVNTGEVVAGLLARSVQTAYTVVGDAVNTAQRLQTVAREGEILVGARTRDLLANAFDLEPRLGIPLKGKSTTLDAYAVMGPSAPRAAATNPLVGRLTERSHVVGGIDRLRAGVGGVIGIVGEPGIGKSRLLAEARRAARDAGVVWLQGQTTSFARSLSYLPFREMIRTYARIVDVDDDATKWSKLLSRVDAVLAAEAVETASYLATLLGIRPPPDVAARLIALDAEALRRQVFRSAYVFFESIARTGPTVLALEDWHWADRSSELLLEHLLPLSEKLLIYWTGRPDPHSAVPRTTSAGANSAIRYLEIRLLPLTDAECTTLVGNIAGVADLPSSIAERVVRRVEGNPFFAEALVRTLVDERTVRRGTGPETAVAFETTASALPPSVQAAITARLDNLTPPDREIIRTAAVIGRTFSRSLLRDLGIPESEIDRGVAALIAHGLIRERPMAVEPDFRFSHTLIQESAYAGILHERRRELHRHVADVLKSRAGERVDDMAGLLAYHYSRAEEWERAQAYLFTVGDQALRIAADTEAIDLYERALDAYARAFGPRWDPNERAVVERKLGEARYRLGEFGLATAHLDRALELLDAARPRSRRAVRLGITREFVAQAGHRIGWRVLRRPVVASSAHEEVLQALWTLQLVDYAADLEKLSYDILSALNLAERLPPSHRTLRAYFGMTLICHNVGLRGLATSYVRMSERVAKDLDDPLAMAIASASLGMHQYAVGHYAAAVESLRASGAGYRTAGDLAPWAGVTAYLNLILVAQGRLTEALPLGDELENVGRAANDKRIRAIGPHCRAHVFSWGGRRLEGRAEFERALEIYRTIPDHHLTLSAVGELATASLRAGDIDATRQLVDQGESLVREHGLRGWWLTPLIVAKASLLAEEAAASTGPARERLLMRAVRACDALRGQTRLHADALAPAYRVLGVVEWLRGRTTRASAAWRRSLEVAAEFESITDGLETHETIARFTSSVRDREIANRITGHLKIELATAIV